MLIHGGTSIALSPRQMETRGTIVSRRKRSRFTMQKRSRGERALESSLRVTKKTRTRRTGRKHGFFRGYTFVPL